MHTKGEVMETEIIDLKEVLERVQDDKELLLELFDIYQGDFVKKRQALSDAINAKDITKIKEIAHSMKGASGNISAKMIYGSCLSLEQLAKSNTTDGMNDLVQQIDVQFLQVKDKAAQLSKEWGGG